MTYNGSDMVTVYFDVHYAPSHPKEWSGVIVTSLQEVFLPFENMRKLRYETVKTLSRSHNQKRHL